MGALWLFHLLSLSPTMETDAQRVLGYSDIKAATPTTYKAALMVVKYGSAQKATSRVLQVNLNVVRKAVIAYKESREIVCNGRPRKLGREHEAELLTEVEKMIVQHRSPTRRQLASRVRLGVFLFCNPVS